MYVYKEKTDKLVIAYDTIQIPCIVKRSRRRSYGLEIDENANVFLKVPMRPSWEFIQVFLEEKERWITEKYKKQVQKKLELEQWKKENPLSETQERALTKRYREAAKEYIPKRVTFYQNQMDVQFEKIVIREQKTRWGSCSSRGTLSFNWRLMLAPPAVLDYVVVHELAHLIEMNHSKAFWSIVEEIMPDYRMHQKWLKENGMKLRLQ